MQIPQTQSCCFSLHVCLVFSSSKVIFSILIYASNLRKKKKFLMGLTVGVIVYLFQSCVKSTEFYYLYNYLSSLCIYQSVFSWAHFPKYNSLFMMISTNISFIIWCLIFFTNQFYSNTVLFFQMLHIDNCTWFWNGLDI